MNVVDYFGTNVPRGNSYFSKQLWDSTSPKLEVREQTAKELIGIYGVQVMFPKDLDLSASSTKIKIYLKDNDSGAITNLVQLDSKQELLSAIQVGSLQVINDSIFASSGTADGYVGIIAFKPPVKLIADNSLIIENDAGDNTDLTGTNFIQFMALGYKYSGDDI